MSTSMTTEANGIRVVTHIIPLDKAEPPFPNETKDETQNKFIPIVPHMTRVFLKAKPMALGTVQILTGLVIVGFGTMAFFTNVLRGEIPLFLGKLFIICGSVTLAAHKGTSLQLIKSTLVLNIICALLSVMGICYFCWALSVRPGSDGCESITEWYSNDCRYKSMQFYGLVDGIKSMLLILSVLQLCVCITLAVFSCKANCQARVNQKVVVVHGAEEALLNVEAPGSPPAYEP